MRNMPMYLESATQECPNDTEHPRWLGRISCPICYPAAIDPRYGVLPKTKPVHYDDYKADFMRNGVI
jgi:hypothetical protein